MTQHSSVQLNDQRRFRPVAAVVALLVVVSAVVVFMRLQAHDAPPSPHRVAEVILRLGYRPRALADITPIVIQEGSLTDPRVSVRLVPVSSPQDGFTKFNAREVDALAGMPLEAVLRQLPPSTSRQFSAYYFQVDVQGQGWVSLVANPRAGVHSIRDLAGKTVGSLPTDQAQYLLRRILVAGGVPADQVRISTYNPQTPLLGLRSGEQSAIFGLEPALSAAQEEGFEVIARGPISQYLYGGVAVPVSVSILASDFAGSHPTAADGLRAMVDRAITEIHDHPETVHGYFQRPQYGALSPTLASRLFFPVMNPPSTELRAVTERYVTDLVQGRLLQTRPNLDPLFP